MTTTDENELLNLMKSKDHGQSKKKKNNVTRAHDQETNPCIVESQMSFKCLDDNGYIRDKCERYFKNYRNCRDFWAHISKERRRAGIKPYLPPFEEREAIRKGSNQFLDVKV